MPPPFLFKPHFPFITSPPSPPSPPLSTPSLSTVPLISFPPSPNALTFGLGFLF